MRISLQDLLFSACGLSILSTIICTLSTVTCSIHIFSLDLVHLVSADTAHFTQQTSLFSPTYDEHQAVNCTAAFRDESLHNRLYTNAVAHYLYLLYVFPILTCLAGPTSISFSQPRMHHSSGRLLDQHHGL